jgi:hypothetical protein
MLTRVTIVIAFLFFILNVRFALGLGSIANILDKGMFLFASAMILATRPTNKIILGLLAANIGMIVLLGFGTSYPQFYWSTLIFGLNQIVIIYVMLSFTPDRKDCAAILITAALLPIASTLVGALYQAAGMYKLYAIEYSTGVARFQGSLIPAFLAGLSMTGAFSALLLALVGRSPIFWIVFLANFVILLMTGGRATLVVTVLMCACTIFLRRDIPAERKIWMIAGGFAGLPIFAVAFGQKLLDRIANSGESGRELIWDYVRQLHAQYPWTGIGFAHQFDSTPRAIVVRIASGAAHNDFLRLKLELGNIGMPLMYLMLTAAVLVSAGRRGRMDLLMVASYGAFLLLSTSDNALANPSYFPLFIVAAMAKYYFDQQGPVPVRPQQQKLWRMADFSRRAGR